MDKIEILLELLAQHGGAIVSTASLSVYDIDQARASGRMYVDKNSLGFVWMPYECKGDFQIPQTVDEVEFFERWYPLDIELPTELKYPAFLYNRGTNPKNN